MSLSGPIVLVSDTANAELAAHLRGRGNLLVNESLWALAPAAIKAGRPAALILDETRWDPDVVEPLKNAIASAREPYMPVLARASPLGGPVFGGALPIAASASPERVLARLQWVLRLRALHAAVLYHLASNGSSADQTASTHPDAPSNPATVLVIGRGRNYRELAAATGERARLISTLSIENAARFLCARDIDGIVIGDGFAPHMLQAFAIALSQDARFRELPVGLVAAVQPPDEWNALPNFERLSGRAPEVMDYMMPLVHLHAYGGRLRRQLAAIESGGLLDPHTGLYTPDAFLREFERVVDDARERRAALSLARFSVAPQPARTVDDRAARQVIRLARPTDIAGRAEDGSILLAFPNTGLGNAHALVRRIGHTLSGSLPGVDQQDIRFDAVVTLAVFKPGDSVETLIARVSEDSAVAAGSGGT
jgi:GGDEF domain-containing protein